MMRLITHSIYMDMEPFPMPIWTGSLFYGFILSGMEGLLLCFSSSASKQTQVRIEMEGV